MGTEGEGAVLTREPAEEREREGQGRRRQGQRKQEKKGGREEGEGEEEESDANRRFLVLGGGHRFSTFSER